MDFKQLIAFRAVFDNGSVTQAAKILGLTQPAVSTQLARLEEAVGFDLFERVAGRLRPTTHGRQFYDEVIRALGSLLAAVSWQTAGARGLPACRRRPRRTPRPPRWRLRAWS